MKVLTWWQYSANENSLEEWDQDVQYYNEETDKFRYISFCITRETILVFRIVRHFLAFIKHFKVSLVTCVEYCKTFLCVLK